MTEHKTTGPPGGLAVEADLKSYTTRRARLSTEVTITIRSLVGWILPVTIKLDQTIAELKQMIQKQRGVRAQDQVLICAGRVWNDHDRLADYDVKDGAVMHMIMKLERPADEAAQLFVVTCTEKTITVEIKLSATVADLKEVLWDKEGIPSCQMRLIFRGRQLEDKETLAGCGLTHEATLHLVTRLSGS